MTLVTPASSSVPWTVAAVVIVCLAAAVVCLVVSLVLALLARDETPRRKLRLKARALLDREDLAGVDLEGMAKLAQALQHLDLSGRFLLFSLGFATAAALAAGLGAIR